MLFNLSEMKFIKQYGLGHAAYCGFQNPQCGGELALCSVPEQMKKLLQITKLESVFNQQAR